MSFPRPWRSCLPSISAVDFFSVRCISKVLDQKQNGHIVLHGLYVQGVQEFGAVVGVYLEH